MSDNIFCFIKFIEKKYVSSFLNGEIYFNSVENLNKNLNHQRGDNLEGAYWLKNCRVEKLHVKNPKIGEFEIRINSEQNSKLINFNYYYSVFSLFTISPTFFSKSNSRNIDERMLEFGDSAILVEEPYKFLQSIITELKKQKYIYQADFVKYENFNLENEFEIHPFLKKNEHQHQMEFRIIVQTNEPITIQIGSIEKYCKIWSSKNMIDTTWEAQRK